MSSSLVILVQTFTVFDLLSLGRTERNTRFCQDAANARVLTTTLDNEIVADGAYREGSTWWQGHFILEAGGGCTSSKKEFDSPRQHRRRAQGLQKAAANRWSAGRKHL